MKITCRRATIEIARGVGAVGVGSTRSGGLLADLHVVSHVAQPADHAAGTAMGVELVEIACTQILVVAAGFEHVIRGHQDLVADGDLGPRRATAALQAAELVGQIGAARLAGGTSCDDQRRLEMDVALARLAAALRAGTFVIATVTTQVTGAVLSRCGQIVD
jgi:hypothetical protein